MKINDELQKDEEQIFGSRTGPLSTDGDGTMSLFLCLAAWLSPVACRLSQRPGWGWVKLFRSWVPSGLAGLQGANYQRLALLQTARVEHEGECGERFAILILSYFLFLFSVYLASFTLAPLFSRTSANKKAPGWAVTDRQLGRG